MRADSALVYNQTGSATPLSRATLTSFDLDGFTLNFALAAAGATKRCGIAIGGTFDAVCGITTMPLTPGLVSLGTAFKPEGALLMSQGLADTTATFGTGTLDFSHMWGLWSAADGHYTSSWSGYTNGAVSYVSALTDSSHAELIQSTGSSTAPVTARLDLDQSANGSLVFDHELVTGAAVAVAYLAFGAQPTFLPAFRYPRRRWRDT